MLADAKVSIPGAFSQKAHVATRHGEGVSSVEVELVVDDPSVALASHADDIPG